METGRIEHRTQPHDGNTRTRPRSRPHARSWATAGLLAGVMALGACQTVPPVPNKRPLTAEARAALAETDVVLTGQHRGVGLSWNSMRANSNPGMMTMMFQANPAVGLLGQAAVMTVMDAGPSRRARRNANALNDAFQNYDLSKSFKVHLDRELSEVEGLDVVDMHTSSTPEMVHDMSDVMGMQTSYVLSEDASAVKVVVDVWIEADDVPYVTPYDYGDHVPRAQRTGPVYSNRFVYVTDRMDRPRMSYTLREALIADIEAAYADLQDDPKAMKRYAKEMEAAQDDELSESEASLFMVRRWAANDAELLLTELDRAHAWVASAVKRDLSSGEVPTFAGGRHKTRVDGTGRIETVVGFGPNAGVFISEPATGPSELPLSFGNTVKIAESNRGFDGGF